MKYSTGIDIVKNNRLNNQKLLDRFLIKEEKEKFNSFLDKNRALEYAAGRWSAKEAIIKASNKKITFSEIKILNDKNGKPVVYINNKQRKDIQISISHEKDYSVAFCILVD